MNRRQKAEKKTENRRPIETKTEKKKKEKKRLALVHGVPLMSVTKGEKKKKKAKSATEKERKKHNDAPETT